MATDEHCLHKRTQLEDVWEDGLIEVCLDCRARRKRVVRLGGRMSKQPYPWISAGEQVKRALERQGRSVSVAEMVIKQATTKQGTVEFVVVDATIKEDE
jgi:hypothetical protein